MNLLIIGYITAFVETSFCVWAFLALPMIPLAYPKSLIVIMFISSSVLQLVLLPVLAVGNKKQGAETRQQAAEQHDLVMSVLTEVKELHQELHAFLLSGKSDIQDKPLEDS